MYIARHSSFVSESLTELHLCCTDHRSGLSCIVQSTSRFDMATDNLPSQYFAASALAGALCAPRPLLIHISHSDNFG